MTAAEKILGILFITIVIACVHAGEQGSKPSGRDEKNTGTQGLTKQAQLKMLEFQKALKDSDWAGALSLCSEKVKLKSAEYDSAESFFKDVLPFDKIISLSEFQIRGRSSISRNIENFICYIDIEDEGWEIPLEWELKAWNDISGWAVDFTDKPLNIWIKHEILKMKVVNGKIEIDREKSLEGFDVRLIPATEKFTIGKPMLFRVEMKNISSETLGYMKTSFTANDRMLVKDPNGNVVPYIDTSYQTGMNPEFVEPGRSVVLADNYDVRSQYHIVKPGRYTFQFKNLRETKPSNIVAVDIQGGELSPSETIVEKLQPVVPQGWEFTRRVLTAAELTEDSGPGLFVNLVGKRIGKRTENAVFMLILFEAKGAEIKLPDYLSELEFWGKSESGLVYGKSSDAEALLPNFKIDITKALNIKPSEDVPVGEDVAKLLKILENEKYANVRRRIISMINGFEGDDLTAFLLEKLKSDDRSQRCDAGFALELLGDRRGVGAIIAELDDISYRPTEMIRSEGSEYQQGQVRQDQYYAALLLGLLGDIRAVPALIEKTKDESINYRAALSLGQIGDNSAIPALKEMLINNESESFRRLFAGYGLAMLGDEQGLEVVIDTLNDPNEQWVNRRYAIEALGSMKSKKAIPYLIDALKDGHPNIRVSAAEALGAIGDAVALPALKEALDDHTETLVNAPKTVSQAAAEAIYEISGEVYKELE